ncbi:MAG TPA: TIGR03087 family PEP-CTERM/XrtA system glycosyltransferase [Planctomycetales bacterium]|jgi:sugar transferase (PEP-CTERM/EpsH1 system associated)|nr:TIGR03087 family PEP-CTERM/XrtA system glycosyltransferase [Planctomycetales bacterium]
MPHSGRPDVLYVVHRTPYPPDKGDRIRAFNVLRYLSRRAAVHLAFLADEPVPEATTAALGRYCERVAAAPLGGSRWLRAAWSLARGRTITEGAFASPLLASIVRGWGEETRFTACLASASSVASYLRLPELCGAPAVVDLVDVDSQKWFDYAAASRPPSAWIYQTEGRRLRRLEQSLAGWARAVTVVSDAEAELFSRVCPSSKAHVIPLGVDLEYFRPTDAAGGEAGCVFVGALDYRPNVDAACWFCQEAWPEIHRRRPETRLRLVGRRPSAAVRRLAATPGVEVVGQVPDVRPYLSSAAVAVNPLRIARGLQNKVLEAMAMGKAVVASPQALAGLRQRDKAPALCATSTAEWVEIVGNLLDQPEQRRRLGAEGRRFVETHHNWDVCLSPFDSLLGLAAGGAAGARDPAISVPEGRA